VIDPDSLFTISLLLLLVLDLITSATRSGLINSSLARLLSLKEDQEAQVNRTQFLLNNLPKLMATLNLSQTILRFLIAGIAILLFVPWDTSPYLAIYSTIILIITGIVIFIFEWLMEWFVSRDPETWALRLTPYATFLTIIFMPILALPLMLYRKTNGDPENSVTVTEDELLTLVDTSQQEGVLEQDERQMIFSIFRLGDTLTREIMVPRIDIVALEITTPLPEAVETFLQSGYSRLPVYNETIDNLLGLLYVKDLLKMWREASQMFSLEEILRPAYFVPETKKVDELLEEMQSQRIHLGIVVDEYGGVAGLVTLEDIVEEIVGEIQDEYDEAEEMPFSVINETEYIFQGRVDLDDFNDIMRCELPKDEADTLGGYIYSRIGKVPSGGEMIEHHNLQLIVEQVAGRRIRKVRVNVITPSSHNSGARENAE
jgi:CBS domain containing-hemolysin-like protein